uniref:Pesticidal crystal cry8Ba protein n=1 Tax=Davidia involucrata TaxID=16924 RepID=A0A5B6Z999_DAVIN
MSTKRLQSDSLVGLRNRGREFGLHLPSRVIPVSRAIPVVGNDSGSDSGSDMVISSDSDDGARYSVDSSPQDEKIPNGVDSRYTNSLHRVHSKFSSSRVTIQQKQGHVVERSRVVGRYPVSNCSSVHSQPNVKTAAKQDFRGRELQNKKLFDDDIPSAPPLAGSVQEINQVAEQVLSSGAHGTPCPTNSNGSATTDDPNTTKSVSSGVAHDNTANRISDPSERTAVGVEAAVSSGILPARLPTFHASGLGPWCAVISYDACVRLCLYSWARGCVEAPIFLENECALLRSAFGLRQVLLQPEEELLSKPSSELVSEGAALKPKKTYGKMKLHVRKVKMGLDPPTGCNFTSLKPHMVKLESLRFHVSNINSTLSSGWGALRKVRVASQIPANSSFLRQSLAYLHAGTQYIKEVSGLLKVGATTLHNSSTSSYEVVQETYSCLLRLKSSSEEDAIRMQPGSGETHVFLPDGPGDDLIIEIHDSKGIYCGRVIAQVATIADDPGNKFRWWSIYHEPKHELVGRIQLDINYSTSPDENSHLKCGSVAETVAYDLVLEVAMKVQHFQQRNLLLHGPWKWLVTEFASYYGISDAYTRLRYLSYVMDVATPTADCLFLVHELLLPVVMKGNIKHTLSHQENRILGEVFDRIEQILALVFENYKSLDESSPSGMVDVFRPATGLAAPALEPALQLYNLLHDILSSEAQLKLCRYFQTAAKKRSRRHLAETDEFVSNNNESTLMDSVTLSTAYQKMRSLCLSIRNEIFTDIEIHNQQLLPSFIDLPNLSSSIYSVELCSRLCAFLVACPPTGPSPQVAELVIATADFQRDLSCWNINPIKGGVDAKELFDLYINRWIQDKRLALLESCKLDKGEVLKVKWSGIRTQHSTTPFVDDMYDQLKEMLNEYEVIIRRWPEYTFVLENAVADVEKAVVKTLDKQYADVLSPLKENLAPIKFGLKYVQKIAKSTVCLYTVPNELGILLNSMKRMLDVLRPKIDAQLKSWGSCIPDGGNTAPGEHLSEVTVMLRTKFRIYLQAVVEKLAENTRAQSATKLKKIIQNTKESVVESDVRSRMQPLKDMLTNTIDHLHTVFEIHVFIIVCRGFWDQMGQDVSRFLENRKDNRSWYKGSRVAVSIIDDTFASQMQQLLGNALQEKDLEPPRSIMQVRSMLCKDAVNHRDDNYYY